MANMMIVQSLRNLLKEMEKEKENTRQNLEYLESEIKRINQLIQEECPHSIVNQHPANAREGYDQFRECAECGLSESYGHGYKIMADIPEREIKKERF